MHSQSDRETTFTNKRSVVPVAEHHDGFALYHSGLSDWTAAKMGPHRVQDARSLK